ncbi:MAG: ATP-binding cassette domain-containing protein [Deltaproteobacteria bacterium]|nr:ATP-binding cassette domain-containing protein [Deltaproteobacteria bacterium]MBW2128341.1 ATP-binding cassette domain-containing protein [Deltaproteobacteria bacterium]MBW2302145.1 ATP-binding cassette domain-containing protein [Deltaproteobacteria bacterium]
MHITLKNIHKHYGKIRANNGITLDILPGTIHGILGENGAGKSTLMKILAGYVRKTRGAVLLDGREVEYRGPASATGLGIGMLYQDPLDFPSMTVIENFMMGRVSGFFMRKPDHLRRLGELADSLGFELDPERTVKDLTVGERQQLELLRLLALGVEVLILDEPTTGISSLQREILFGALKSLAARGKTILLVSHKLEDMEVLCDRLTVLRQGKVTGEMSRPFDTAKLLNWMFGSVPAPPPCSKARLGEPVLSVKELSGAGGRAGLRSCTMTIRQGEVVGLAGLSGSGQDVFLRLAAGLLPPLNGRILLGARDMTGKGYHSFRDRGVTFLPTARLEEGLIPGLSILEHFALHQRGGIRVAWNRALSGARENIRRFRIVGNPYSAARSLSGGNQQRLLLSLIPRDPRLLLLENPTRGLDMESVQWVWEHLMTYVEKGASIIFSSPELEEIMQVADRVVVFFNGSVVRDVKTGDTNLEDLGRAIAGRV